MRQFHIDHYASGEGDGKPYEVEHGEPIPYRELPPGLRGTKITKIWFDEYPMTPIDESHDERVEENGVQKWKNQTALIFVDEAHGNYGALILTGTAGIKEELSQMGREAADHALEKVYPRTKGLWIFEGELVFADPEEMPEWQGSFRSINATDFKKLGI